MTHDPAPPAIRGVIWRPLTLDDAPGLSALGVRIDAAEGLMDVAGPDLVRWFLALDSVDLEHDTLGAFAADGRALADVELMLRGSGEERRAYILVAADPAHTDLEPFLVAWGEARARQRLLGKPDAMVRVMVEEHRGRLRSVVENAGFVEARHFVKMYRPLTDTPAPPPLPEGMELVTWSDALDREIWTVNNTAFGDHWGSVPMSWEDWRAWYAEDPDSFLPEHSFIALEEGQVAAYCMCEQDPEEIERIGTRVFWVGRLGTLPSHRRQGLGTALLLSSLDRARKSGFEAAALSVDEDSQTNATAIYERAGFTITNREVHYLKDL